MITALAGGVGAARLLQGLIKIVPEEELTVIINTGDDINLYNLHISPDIDIVVYTLAGIVNNERGWGVQGDTFHCLEMLKRYGYQTWFNLGDRDFATHIHRTILLQSGLSLSIATRRICRSLGLAMKILPMTDDEFETKILTDKGIMHFQNYLVEKGARDEVVDVIFEGSERARPAPGVIDSILDAEAVIVCPSNPIVSIGTILSITDVRKSLRETRGKVAAVSPIIGGAPVKGPADKLMRGLGLEVSAYSVAHLYRDFIDIFVIDRIDKAQKERIEDLGIRVVVTDTIMKSLQDKVRLAKVTLRSLRRL